MCLRLLDTDFLKGDKDIQIENTSIGAKVLPEASDSIFAIGGFR